MAAFLLAVIFSANIASGKIHNSPFMSDVAEAIILFSASIFFVIGVLCLEDAEKQSNQNDNGRNENVQGEGKSHS